MKATEILTLRGSLLVNVRRAGVIVESWRDDNMIMLAARVALAQLIAGDGAGKVITKIGVGTDSNGPTPADTALTSPFIKNLQGHEYPAAGRVQFNWRLETTEANGKIIREFGLITADDALFARKTRAPIEKADDISLDGAWTIIF